MAFPNFFGGNRNQQQGQPQQQGQGQNNMNNQNVNRAGTPNNAQSSSFDGMDANIANHNQNMNNAVSGSGGNNNQPPAPLDGFKDLWNTAATDPDAPKKPTGVLPDVTAEQLSQALSNADFTRSIAPELMQKAMSGDQQAFMDVLNQSNRAALTQAILATRGMVETGVKNHGSSLATSLPSMVRSSNVTDRLQSNPLYQNPAARPLIDSLRTQMESKNPHASADEISQMVDSYMQDFVKAAGGSSASAGNSNDGSNRNSPKETDWYAVLGLGN